MLLGILHQMIIIITKHTSGVCSQFSTAIFRAIFFLKRTNAGSSLRSKFLVGAKITTNMNIEFNIIICCQHTTYIFLMAKIWYFGLSSQHISFCNIRNMIFQFSMFYVAVFFLFFFLCCFGCFILWWWFAGDINGFFFLAISGWWEDIDVIMLYWFDVFRLT